MHGSDRALWSLDHSETFRKGQSSGIVHEIVTKWQNIEFETMLKMMIGTHSFGVGWYYVFQNP